MDSNLNISSPSAFSSPSALSSPPPLSSPPSPEPIFLREKNQEDSSKDPHQENTVRIPVRKLDRLNDLFGELTIERNGLSLQLGRLRTLVDNLSRRVKILEASNHKLRTSYDQIATPRGMAARQGDGETSKSEGLVLPSSVSSPAASDASSASPASLAITVQGFDALEMDSYSDLHLLSREVMETIVQIEEVTSDLELTLDDTDSIAHELNKTAKQLQTNLTQVRMRPLSDLVGRFSRALRDLSVEHGKQVELKVVGKGTLIDRTILETLSDPLMHLLRNAFDHGIEDPSTRQAMGKPPKGTIEIKAIHRGNQTQLTLRDDGKGINLTKIRARAEEMGLDQELLASASDQELLSLIFEPGFSTADQVTDLSGRGVGMDVVRNNLKQIRGNIRVDTQPGWGTTFTLTVPFTLSVARILLVESNGMLLAFPIDVIQEMLMLKSQQIITTLGNEVINWQGKMVSLIRMKKWLKFYCRRRVTTLEETPSINEPTILIINQAEQLIGLCVDRSWGEREVTVRQVEGNLGLPDGFSGCTILGNGRVVPLVDANAMLRWIISCQRTTNLESLSPQHCPTSKGFVEQQPPSIGIQPSTKDTILIIDDSINVRRMLALGLEKAGYIVEHAKDGQDGIEKLLRGLEVKAIICDIEMPRLDGYGFLTRVKGEPSLKTLPIIMLTSRSVSKH
ncbi:MAG: response regulator, partial [Moorea sp. SIO4G2]|nr:response regulator [Moorena sp. SIO4G2]